jgi:hypothetical protein
MACFERLPTRLNPLAERACFSQVLFIVVDDMRPDLGAYNATIAHTPNMDRLAATGMLFSRAYVQVCHYMIQPLVELYGGCMVVLKVS